MNPEYKFCREAKEKKEKKLHMYRIIKNQAENQDKGNGLREFDL